MKLISVEKLECSNAVPKLEVLVAIANQNVMAK